ncbi:hypothetical protein EDC01DRAFT_597316, partial [Geopyxis carbonaria]
SQQRQQYFMPPLLTPVSDGPAPPPAPSCPPPDTPVSEFGHPRGPPGGYLRSMAMASGGGSFRMGGGLPLMGKRMHDTRDDGDGGTPTGFLGRKAKPLHGRKGSDETTTGGRGPPPLGARPRGASGSSGLGKMERPPSTEGDDPIPPEYRPRGEKKEGSGNSSPTTVKKEKRSDSNSSGSAQQMQERRPPQNKAPTVNAQRSPEKAGFGRVPPNQNGGQQRSPAEVGLGGYLYSKPIPPPSAGNSGTSNPRFPGGQITSPLHQHQQQPTSPPGSIGTRESVMRGQWVDDTAAVAGPVPVSKEQQIPQQQPQQSQHNAYPGYENGQQQQHEMPDASVYKAYTQPFEPEEREDVVDEEDTNPSASPTPDIAHLPHIDSLKRGSSSEDSLFASLSELIPSLPPTHINSLLSFAMYLSEDNAAAEKAEKIRMGDGPGIKEQIGILGEQRVRRWKEWSKLEELARTQQINSMNLLAPSLDRQPPLPQSNPFHDEHEDARHYDGGLQPLPPPPKLSGFDEFGGHHYGHGRRDSGSTYHHEVPGDLQHERETPSPTPTIDQIAAAPKVELELQMPRPMPSVPASRIDPNTRRRLMTDDDASTIASDTPAPKDSSIDMGHPGGTPYPFPFPKRAETGFHEGKPIETKALSAVIASFARASSGAAADDSAELMAAIPQVLHDAYAALNQATNVAPLSSYLDNARRALEAASQQRIAAFTAASQTRRATHAANTNALASTGRLTYADLDRMREQFEHDEAALQCELDADIYTLFETSYVEVAYKDVKASLSDLGGRWYDEVRTWLYTVSSAGALEYYLLLEALDLLNKLHVCMEEHEHTLQSLVTERNARYLTISIGPLVQQGETARAADAERRYWIDEQERQLRAKLERGKRVAEHARTVDRVADRVVAGLRTRFGAVLEAVWGVVWQFPPSIQPTLLRKFFDENTMPIPDAGAQGPGRYTVAAENVKVLADAVQTLGEIVGLIKLALDFRAAPRVRVAEATTAIAVAEEHAHANGVTAPTATAAACAKGVKARLPAALKRVAEEGRAQGDTVVAGLVEVLERLRGGVSELARQGGRQQQQQQQGGQQQGNGGGLSVSTMIGGFRRQGQNTNSMLISPGAYSPSGYSPA